MTYLKARSEMAVPWIFTALAIYLIIVVLAGVLAPTSYSTLRNTISDLGSQGFPKAWLIRFAFIGLGASVLVSGMVLGFRAAPGLARFAVSGPLTIYSLCLILTGVFRSRAIMALRENFESLVHTFCATLAGIAFMSAIVSVSIVFRSSKKWGWMSFGAFIFCSTFSLLFFLDPELQGLWQRLLHLTSLLWLATALHYAYRDDNSTPYFFGPEQF